MIISKNYFFAFPRPLPHLLPFIVPTCVMCWCYVKACTYVCLSCKAHQPTLAMTIKFKNLSNSQLHYRTLILLLALSIKTVNELAKFLFLSCSLSRFSQVKSYLMVIYALVNSILMNLSQHTFEFDFF